MQDKNAIITTLFHSFADIRYVAIYTDNELISTQKESVSHSSASDTDKYEELLTNPILLTTARQRGNIDCGGLRYVIVGYGNFFQLVKEIKGGHISICLEKSVDLTHVPDKIFDLLRSLYPALY